MGEGAPKMASTPPAKGAMQKGDFQSLFWEQWLVIDMAQKRAWVIYSIPVFFVTNQAVNIRVAGCAIYLFIYLFICLLLGACGHFHTL